MSIDNLADQPLDSATIRTEESTIMVLRQNNEVRLVEIMNDLYTVNVVTIGEVIDPTFDQSDAFTIARAIMALPWKTPVPDETHYWPGEDPLLPISFWDGEFPDLLHLAAIVYCWHTAVDHRISGNDETGYTYGFHFDGFVWDVAISENMGLQHIEKLKPSKKDDTGGALLTKSVFSIDATPEDMIPVEGYTNGDHWNGWAISHFTREAVENYLRQSFTPESGCSFHFDGEVLVIELEGSDPIQCTPASIATVDGLLILYNLDGWCWDNLIEWDDTEASSAILAKLGKTREDYL